MSGKIPRTKAATREKASQRVWRFPFAPAIRFPLRINPRRLSAVKPAEKAAAAEEAPPQSRKTSPPGDTNPFWWLLSNTVQLYTRHIPRFLWNHIFRPRTPIAKGAFLTLWYVGVPLAIAGYFYADYKARQAQEWWDNKTYPLRHPLEWISKQFSGTDSKTNKKQLSPMEELNLRLRDLLPEAQKLVLRMRESGNQFLEKLEGSSEEKPAPESVEQERTAELQSPDEELSYPFSIAVAYCPDYDGDKCTPDNIFAASGGEPYEAISNARTECTMETGKTCEVLTMVNGKFGGDGCISIALDNTDGNLFLQAWRREAGEFRWPETKADLPGINAAFQLKLQKQGEHVSPYGTICNKAGFNKLPAYTP